VLNLDNQTVRERARVTLDGPQIRIRLTNENSSSPSALTKKDPLVLV
jgi:hypothetical protein